jgi:glycosyltransferase involved in cell wall biosynthesis
MIITIDGNIPSTFAHSMNVMKMAQGFLDIGEDVTLVTLLTWPNWKDLLKVHNIYHFYGVSPKIKIKWVPVYNRDFWTKKIHAKGFNEKAAQIIASAKTNYVYCRSFLTAYLCVKKSIPVILETHTTHYQNEDLQKVYTIAGNSNFLGLVTIHDDIKNQHISNGIAAEKVLVLPDGVDLKQFDLNLDQRDCRKQLGLSMDKKIILYCGSLHPEKGINSIIECATLFKNCNDCQFVIVGGNNQDVLFWQKQAMQNNVHVDFVGFVPHSEVPMYLKAADVLLMPYSKKIDYQVMDVHTTSPLKLYEYMASGVPIVSTNITAVSSVVPHLEGALLAEPDDVQQLCDHIEKLLYNPDLAARLTKYAKEKVVHYQWQSRCLKIRNSFLSPAHV